MTSYLDHAATTPMLPEAVAAMTATLAEVGNASSLHASGRRARRTVEESRERLAAALGARPSEVVLTAGGTESDNLAVKGIFWARREADPRRRRVVASAIEHHAVLDAVDWLERHEGAEVTWLPVDRQGRVHPAALAEVLGDDVALVTVMWANNEVGTVQPVRELAAAAHEHGVPLHTDAVQAVGALDVDFARSGVDALTLTGHKLGGPFGAGALLLRRDVACTALLHGGGQERDVRSGTLDTAGIVGFSVAAEIAVATLPERAAALGRLRDALVAGVLDRVPDAVLNGHPADRLPGNAHFSFPGCEGDSLLMLLDARGVECSTGSACSAGVARPSHVLLAMGAGEERARGSLRFSLGHTSTEADVAAVLEAIGPVVERARRAGLAMARWSEREGSQRERGATAAVRPEGRGLDRREERAQGEREGSQRERGATAAVRPEGRGLDRTEERAR
jgi:cysteine desulfurase